MGSVQDRSRDEDGGGRRVTVRPARAHDAAVAGRLLADAFAEDDVMCWLLPDPADRLRVGTAFFQATTRWLHPLRRGSFLAFAAGEPVGVAVWAPPGTCRPPWWRQLPAVPQLIRSAGARTLRDFGTRGQAIEESLLQAHPPEPHWYLVVLGVRSGSWGAGAGSALVAAGLRRCERDGTPAYLECLERLVPYYQRLGLTSRGSIAMPAGSPAQFGMWFDPHGNRGPGSP